VKEDKPDKPIPKEAERAANWLLYGTSKAAELKAKTEKARWDPEEVEWVAQWTYGTAQRPAERIKIGVEKWAKHPPGEIKESHICVFEPTIRYLKSIFGDFIVKDRDFKLYKKPAGTWDREHPLWRRTSSKPVDPVEPFGRHCCIGHSAGRHEAKPGRRIPGDRRRMGRFTNQ
jgi:hypothetical protein